MKIDIPALKSVIADKQYKWFEDQPNIIAIRSNLQVPDVFNDPFFIVYKENGIEKLFTAVVTTEPGTTYQKKLLNEKGCWVMDPAQMIDAYSPGLHQGKADHRCLRSTGKIFGHREDDRDGVLFNDKNALSMWVDGTTVGANIHGAYHKDDVDLTRNVGPWSAGCQVHERWSKKEQMMDIITKLYPNLKKVTYTLLVEKDFK